MQNGTLVTIATLMATMVKVCDKYTNKYIKNAYLNHSVREITIDIAL